MSNRGQFLTPAFVTAVTVVTQILLLRAPFVLSHKTLLPNTSGINGELTAKLGVDNFFSLWIVFNNDDVLMSDKPFTILAPRNNASSRIPLERLKSQPETVKKLLLDHIVLGQKLDLGIGADLSFTTLGGRTVTVKSKPALGGLVANGAKVHKEKVEVDHGRLIVLDNYLFPEDLTADHSFLQDMTEVLSFLQGGVRVFQHLLARSNVTRMLLKDDTYTVLVPTDRAFQRWHPIDWGFYPFSVPEFTEKILSNHFLKGNIKQDSMPVNTPVVVHALGGNKITLYKTPDGNVTANGVELVRGDTPITKGNIMFITEVLFVDDAVVSKLQEEHRDKETPPLLALPWINSQFLSHVFLALESDRRFTHITRFLNAADLVSHISGAGYTFFVPTDNAWKKLGLEHSPDNLLANSEQGMTVFLSHFVKGRLYDKDIHNGAKFISLSNRTLHVVRKPGTNGTIEGASIIEREVFVYNLGTMFYIDSVIFGDEIPPPVPVTTTSPGTTLPGGKKETEWTEEEPGTTYADILLEDLETTASTVTAPTTTLTTNSDGLVSTTILSSVEITTATPPSAINNDSNSTISPMPEVTVQ